MLTSLAVEYEPPLVEAAVLGAVRGHPAERAFTRARARAYAGGDAEARDAAFAALHAAWFQRLGLDQPFAVALAERPDVVAGCGRCVVARARDPRDECADLRVAGDGPPLLLVLVTVDTVTRRERLLGILRRELLHVADMLDPAFGYAPSALGGEAPARARLVRDRYRVLWDAYVDGRLTRLGRALPGAREERLFAFVRAFPSLGDRTEAGFERFFGIARCTHAELVAFASGTDEGAGCRTCSLCGLPTTSFEPGPAVLGGEVLAAIVRDFPAWAPARGICARCVELYRCGGVAASSA